MLRGSAPVFVRRRQPSKRQVLQALAFNDALMRRMRGPGGLGGRQRALAAGAGDPFRFRLPKLSHLFKVPKGIRNLAKAALPIVGSAILPGLGTVVGSLAAGAAEHLSNASSYKTSSLTGPGAPSQDYPDQEPQAPPPTRFVDQGAGPGVPVIEGTEVTSDDSLTDTTDDSGGLTDDEIQQLQDAGATDDDIAQVQAMISQ
jgi:hypothetical protein